MRAFVAVMVPSRTGAALLAALQPVIAVESSARHVRWEQPDRWHITLAFLGDVDRRMVDDLAPRLGRAAGRTPALELSVEGIGRFGNRVLYSRVGGDRGTLRRLAERAQAAARRSGATVAERRFRPHVTLGRARGQIDLRPFVEVGREVGGQIFTAYEICLVESILTGDRRYEILGRYRLQSSV